MRRLTLVALLCSLFFGCSKDPDAPLDLEKDVEKLAQLPALTGAAIVLSGPAWCIGIAMLIFSIGALNGLKVKVKIKAAQEEGEESK